MYLTVTATCMIYMSIISLRAVISCLTLHTINIQIILNSLNFTPTKKRKPLTWGSGGWPEGPQAGSGGGDEHGMGVHGIGGHRLGMRPAYRLDSAVCLGQNHRESRDQEWSLENRSQRTEHCFLKRSGYI